MLTIPFDETAPVVDELIRSNEPLVRPVEVEPIFKAIPVVRAFAEMFWTVPAAVESAVSFNSPAFELEA